MGYATFFNTGVFGDPQNKLKKALSMTAPVITKDEMQSEKMSMTAPVLTDSKKKKMGFVLPFEYTKREDIPDPTDERVNIKEIPPKVVAVSKFSGWFSQDVADKHLDDLCTKLKKDHIIEEDITAATLDWCVAQYHPPFTIPFLRRNEVWVNIDKSKISLQAK
mmetsp:Transcript_32181/g.32805  ORF Transcript_32181/g.32805 Transcript_32181/m.32805 type:complete len:163 (-) Transcript_32181:156-644(-)